LSIPKYISYFCILNKFKKSMLRNYYNNYLILYYNTMPSALYFFSTRPTTMPSLFTNNAQVYYKPHSLASGGTGTVKNSRHKSRKT
ncbi:MAG: hypothetical protein WD512_08490, partial [Candidatus Paceibacterota bacterium]